MEPACLTTFHNSAMTDPGGDNTASTSISIDLSDEVRRELHALFNWKPRRLYYSPPVPRTTTTKSTSTCPPSYFDRHFSPNLILEHVKPLTSLVSDLEQNVDRALSAASATLSRAWNVLTAEARKSFVFSHSDIVRDENDVASVYERTTPWFCAPVASALGLHPKASQWQTLLGWTRSFNSAGYATAVADGELRILERRDEDETANMMSTMDSDTRDIVREMMNASSSLGTWEFTASDDVIKAVGKLGSSFTWTRCGVKCPKKNLEMWTESAKKVVVGFDAKHPPWNLNLNVCSCTPTLVDVADYPIGHSH